MDMQQVSNSDFVISQAFELPREEVWRAWTEAERLKEWFGPRGYTMLTTQLDLRPGGVFHYAMRSPEGQEMWGKWVFEEVERPQRLVFVSSFSDASGGMVRHPMLPEWPLEVRGELRLAERDGRTIATLSSRPVRATPQEEALFKSSHPMMEGGWKGTLEQLGAYLAAAQMGGGR